MRMRKKPMRKFFHALMDERGSQNAKSAVGILFFFVFIGGGALINSSSLPLSYNIAFGDSGGGSGSGENNGGGGGGSYGYSMKTKARIDYLRLTLHYENGIKEVRSVGSVANDVTAGSAGWLLPENTITEDGNRAITELRFGETSYYLHIANIGFTTPKNARITGLTLEVKRSAEGNDAIRDYSVRLTVGGKIVGAEKKHADPWPSNDAFDAYGGKNDLWGLASLSPNEANNPSFGVVIAAQNDIIPPPPAIAVPQATVQKTAPSSASTVPVQTSASVQSVSPAQSTKVSANNSTNAVNDIETLIAAVEKNAIRANVVALQNALIRADRGPASKNLIKLGAMGYYGPTTKKAVKEWRSFQKAQSVKQAQSARPAAIPIIPSLPESDSDTVQKIVTPLIRGDQGNAVLILQDLLIKWNIGPEARHVAHTGSSGIYGWRTERGVAELQDLLIRNNAGPAAQTLKDAFVKYGYGKGSWGNATKAATIEFLQTLR